VSRSAWLIDKSALSRLGASPDGDLWTDRIERGLVHVCTVTLLEIGYSSRTARDHRDILESMVGSMPIEYCTPVAEDRAFEVQGLLASRGRHRGPSVSDLLLAATAEMTRRTILHIDKDFDVIAAVTRQPVERLRV
jgi:predicted nucleic acid-binding protein